MSNEEIYKELKVVSTWRFILYSTFTMGLYPVWYMYRQSSIVNRICNTPISAFLLDTTLVFAVLSLILGSINLFLWDSNWEQITDVLDDAYLVLVVIWSVQFRSKLHDILGYSRKSKGRFSFIWVVLLDAVYFNFKVNRYLQGDEQINEERNAWKEWWFTATILLIIISIPVFGLVLTFLTPQIAQMVQDRGEVLGIISQIVMSTSNFIQKNLLLLLLGLGLLTGIFRDRVITVYKWGLSLMGIGSVFMLVTFLLEQLFHAIGTLGLIEMIPGVVDWISG